MRIKQTRAGAVNPLALSLVFLIILTLLLGGLAVWSLLQYQRVSTTVEEQKQEAAAIARNDQQRLDEAAFIEREKEPFRTYSPSAVLGSFSVAYPKTWSVYADESQSSTTQLDVYMHPGVVQVNKSAAQSHAFRVQLQRKLYTEVIRTYQRQVEKQELTAQSVTIANIKGTQFNGKIDKDHTGSLILLPVRDKTLLIWTESLEYQTDFKTIISKLQISP